MSIKEKLLGNPRTKKILVDLVVHPIKARPQWWVRLFIPFYTKRGKGSVIYRSVRKDLLPNHIFSLGRNSVIEDYCAVNNGIGDVVLGDRIRLGIGGTIIGPVEFEDYVVTGQNCLISGLVHNYEDPGMPIVLQPATAAKVKIGRGTYLGSNSVVVAGVTIGEHCVIGAGSVVNRDVPSYTVCAGVPARPLKRYNFETRLWEKV